METGEGVGPGQLLVHHLEPTGDRLGGAAATGSGPLFLDGLEIETDGPSLVASPGQGLFVGRRHRSLGSLFRGGHEVIMPPVRAARKGSRVPGRPGTVTGD